MLYSYGKYAFVSKSYKLLLFLITGKTELLPSNMSWDNLSKEREKNLLKQFAKRAKGTFKEELEKTIREIDTDESYAKPKYFEDIGEYYQTNILPIIKVHEAKRLAWLADFRFKGIMIMLFSIVATMLLYTWSANKFSSDGRAIFIILLLVLPLASLIHHLEKAILITERKKILESVLRYCNLKLYSTPIISLEELFKYGVRNTQPFNQQISTKNRDYLVGFKNTYKIEIVSEFLTQANKYKEKLDTETFIRITLPTIQFKGTNVFNAQSINALAETAAIPAPLIQLNIEDPYQKLDPSSTGVKGDFSDYTMSLYEPKPDQFLSNSEIEGKNFFNEHFVTYISPRLENALFQKNLALLKVRTFDYIRKFIYLDVYEAATFIEEITSIIGLCSTINAVIEHIESLNANNTTT